MYNVRRLNGTVLYFLFYRGYKRVVVIDILWDIVLTAGIVIDNVSWWSWLCSGYNSGVVFNIYNVHGYLNQSTFIEYIW